MQSSGMMCMVPGKSFTFILRLMSSKYYEIEIYLSAPINDSVGVAVHLTVGQVATFIKKFKLCTCTSQLK